MRTMKLAVTFAVVAGLAAGLVAGAESAFAKSGRNTLAPVAAAALDGARVRVRAEQKGRGRAEVRIDVARAAEGLALEAWFAAADDTMTYAGAFVADAGTPGEYRFRVRTKSGDPLPGGAASLSELAGRAVEIREAGGAVVASGTMPGAPGRKAAAAPSAGTAGPGADDPATHDVGDDRGGGSGGGNSGSSGGGRGRGRGADGAGHR